MNELKPKEVLLKNYAKPNFYIINTRLFVDLYEEETLVTSELQIEKNPQNINDQNLKLDGEDLELIEIKLNKKTLTSSEYSLSEEGLCIFNVPNDATLEIKNKIKPALNTELSGLYVSSHIFCTQCEAEGFRRITYYLDRPDVLSVFTTTITADKKRYPFLLSNGNLIEQGDLDNDRHFATWHDPFKKPCYLFALVAGDLALLESNYVTRSNRNILLQIYVEKENKDKCDYAMQALKKAMQWDEQRFNLEYDLDRYMIVAVNDFNMGAMENKGLNLFNSKYILADRDIATDNDFLLVEAVIGHEYFHNWSGNRITCRDWFQLSLKEGLTIFREHEFCADFTSSAAKRIEDVNHLRAFQFPQDAGPMAHPVRPDSYLEINNFYTVTIYEKGAEVIRMIQTLLGKENFDKGLALYFKNNDGKAATIEDFIAAMEEVSNKDLTQFKLWYTQAGTPVLTIKTNYSPSEKVFTIEAHQQCPTTPGQAIKHPFVIPIVLGLLDQHGEALHFTVRGDQKTDSISQCTLELTKAKETFYLDNVTSQPIPSLLRGFSAPVKLLYDYSDDELRLLALHDKDGFNRFEARQRLLLKLTMDLITKIQKNEPLCVEDEIITDFKTLLNNPNHDKLLLAELLTIPSQKYIAELVTVIDVDAIFYAREFIAKEIATKLKEDLLACYLANDNTDGDYELTTTAIGQRSLKNICLSYLAKIDNEEIHHLLWQQFDKSNNMTDRSAAIVNLTHLDCKQRIDALDCFYQRYQHVAVALDKWFSVQSISTLSTTLTTVQKLLKHPQFTWNTPNRARSVLMSFCVQNPLRFHDVTGKGYELLADSILHVDPINPQLAARLCEPLIEWKRHLPIRQELMSHQLQRLLACKTLSKDSYEIVSKSLK